jgi:hypothetical protein
VSFEYAQASSLIEIPEAYSVVRGARESTPSVVAPSRTPDLFRMSFEHAQAPSVGEIPKADSVVRGARESALSVIAPSYAPDLFGMPFEHAQAPSVFEVPEPDGFVLGSGKSTFTMRTKGNGVDAPRVAKREDFLRELISRRLLLCGGLGSRRQTGFEELLVLSPPALCPPIDIEKLREGLRDRRIVEPERDEAAFPV